MPETHSQRLSPIDDFHAEFSALAEQESLIIELGALEAWVILGQIQLASRHPGNIGPSAMIARAIARQLQDRIATTPALKRVAALGWDPDHDQPSNNHDLTITWAYWHNKLNSFLPATGRVLAIVLRAIV